MTVSALLIDVVSMFRNAGVPHMLTGSFAAAVHGAGRATMDIDFVIDPDAAALEAFTAAVLDSGRYVSPEVAREALIARTMFNVVDVKTGWKLDLIVRKHRAFSVAEFSRRSELLLGSTLLPVATVEDLVLAKLEWTKLGGSRRQLDDVRTLLFVAGEAFDRTYVESWLDPLGITALWRSVVTSSEGTSLS